MSQEPRSIGRRSAIQQPADGQMPQPRQNLAFGFESSMHGIGIHAALHDLHGHLLLELAVAAMGQVDNAHAAPSDLAIDRLWTHSLVRLRLPIRKLSEWIACGRRIIDSTALPRRLTLSDADKAALVAFQKTLTA